MQKMRVEKCQDASAQVAWLRKEIAMVKWWGVMLAASAPSPNLGAPLFPCGNHQKARLFPGLRTALPSGGNDGQKGNDQDQQRSRFAGLTSDKNGGTCLSLRTCPVPLCFLSKEMPKSVR